MLLFFPVAFLCPGTVSLLCMVLCKAERDGSVPVELMLTCLPDLTVPKMGYFSCLSSATYTGAVCCERLLRENCLSEISPWQKVIEASLALSKLETLIWTCFDSRFCPTLGLLESLQQCKQSENRDQRQFRKLKDCRTGFETCNLNPSQQYFIQRNVVASLSLALWKN